MGNIDKRIQVELKDDKSHDKFNVTDKVKGEFICNEKLYWDHQLPEDHIFKKHTLILLQQRE